MEPVATVVDVDEQFTLRSLFYEAESQQFEVNRRAARQCEFLAEVLDHARMHPDLYVDATSRRGAGALPPLGGEAELAVRCAALEAASRLRLTENEVRMLAELATRAQSDLPRVWEAARDGFTSIEHVKAVLSQLPLFTEHVEAVAGFDEVMRDIAISATVAGTRRQARAVADRLVSPTRTQRHAAAFARRHVYVDPAPDGMSWVCALVATERAHGIDRHLTRSVKAMTVEELDGRTSAQARADVFAGLLTGTGDTGLPVVSGSVGRVDGVRNVTEVRIDAGPGIGAAATPGRGVKTKVLVTIPFDRLAPEVQATVRHSPGTGAAGLDLNAEPLIPGAGPIDDATARQLLLDAGAFTRVITDPITGVILDMDRRARFVTRAQREWLTLVHGKCLRDGCERLAIDADIDHWCGYHGPGRGQTNIGNLDPLCDPDHAVKDTTRLEHRRRDDGSVEVGFPSGHHTENPFAGLAERVRAILDRPNVYGDTPPF